VEDGPNDPGKGLGHEEGDTAAEWREEVSVGLGDSRSMQSTLSVTWSRSKVSTFGMAVASRTPIMPDIEWRGDPSTPLAFQACAPLPALSPLARGEGDPFCRHARASVASEFIDGSAGFARAAHLSRIRGGPRGDRGGDEVPTRERRQPR
jgi:hypothetical protein